jgi:hypothetical protein
MTRRLLDVIQRAFVEERGVRVIMTTHSPSTVALVPEASLFEMRRQEAPRLRRPPNKSSLIADLTDGFLVVHEGMSVVFCEGDNDSPFYKVVWERLTEPTNLRGDSTLARTPPLVFMHGKGIATIRGIVPQLRGAGLLHFHGLIDLDVGNKSEDGIHVIGRRAIENYLFDPINIWFYLHNEGKSPKVEGVEIPRGQRTRVRGLSNDQLQRIAEKVLGLGESNLAGLSSADKQLEPVHFVGGKSLEYPRWLLHSKKEALRAAYCKVFPGLRGNDYAGLTTSFAALDMVPSELLELMCRIQNAAKWER